MSNIVNRSNYIFLSIVLICMSTWPADGLKKQREEVIRESLDRDDKSKKGAVKYAIDTNNLPLLQLAREKGVDPCYIVKEIVDKLDDPQKFSLFKKMLPQCKDVDTLSDLVVQKTCGAQCVGALYAYNAHIDKQDKVGRTPLNYAVNEGNIEKIKKLLFCRADIFKKDKFGETPIDRAGELLLIRPPAVFVGAMQALQAGINNANAGKLEQYHFYHVYLKLAREVPEWFDEPNACSRCWFETYNRCVQYQAYAKLIQEMRKHKPEAN